MQVCRNTVAEYISAAIPLQQLCRIICSGYSSAGTPTGSNATVNADLATRADLKLHLQGSLIQDGEGSLALLPQHYPA